MFCVFPFHGVGWVRVVVVYVDELGQLHWPRAKIFMCTNTCTINIEWYDLYYSSFGTQNKFLWVIVKHLFKRKLV